VSELTHGGFDQRPDGWDTVDLTPPAPGVLTREQVEERTKWYGENFVLYRARWANELLATDAALRATITQQVQLLERVKKDVQRWRDSSDTYYKELAAMTRERDAYKAQCQCIHCGTHHFNISICSKCTFNKPAAEPFRLEVLEQQLAASQARCREMEADVWKAHVPCTGTQHDPLNGLLHGYCVRCRQEWPCEYSPERHHAQLQATLAAREAVIGQQEATIRGYRHSVKIIGQQHDDRKAERDAAVQEAGRLREALSLLYDHQNGCPLPKYEPQWNEAMRLTELALNPPQAHGSSGGAANHGEGT